MSVSIISKSIGGTHQYRKSIPAAMVAGMIMGFLVGCQEAYGATLKKPTMGFEPASTEIGVLSEQIKQSVKALEYCDKVSENFVEMALSWKDAKGPPVLVGWKNELDHAREDYKQGKTSKAQLAKIEQTIIKELSHRIKKEISGGRDASFDLTSVMKHKQAQCLSYSQLFYVLGNSVGLSVRTTHVLQLMIPSLLPAGESHAACISDLPDRTAIMIDLAVWPKSLVSTPFELKREFTKVGNYWELRNRENPLGIHRRIQILDRNGLIACIHFSRGTIHFDLGRFTESISDLNKAIELNPKFASAYTARGAAYGALGQHTKAISDHTKAIELDPKYPDAYYNRGNVYSNLDQHTKAISDYIEAIKLDPNCLEAYTNRGNAYDNLGQHIKALSDYNKATELNGKCASAYNGRGVTYAKLGEFSKALSDFNKAIELDPNLAKAYSNRGNVYNDLGQPTKALSDFNKAIELNPKYAKSYYNRGNAYRRLGQDSKGISDYNKAIELEPEYVRAYINRGGSYVNLGQYNKGISDCNKAIELNPKYAGAYINRAVGYAFLGKSAYAKKDLLEAVELNPDLKGQVQKVSDQFKLNLKLD